MAKKVESIIEEAKARAKAAGHDEENLFVMMGTISADTPQMLTFKKGLFSLDSGSVDAAKERGKKIFKKFAKYLKQAVCEDFKYCQRKEDVKGALDKHLPELVKAILKRIPITGKLPEWLVKVLGLIGVSAASTEVLVTMFVAWIIIKGCDELCGCAD